MRRVTEIEELLDELEQHTKGKLEGQDLDFDQSASAVCAIPGPISGAEWCRERSRAIPRVIRVSCAGEIFASADPGRTTWSPFWKQAGKRFDPPPAVHTSLVQPWPHQITALYESMLPRPALHILLADHPLAYNAPDQSWPAIDRLARETAATGPLPTETNQSGLFGED